MKSLFAFSSGGGGGSGFPGAPVAGVYTTATAPEFLSVCAEVVAVPFSIVVRSEIGGLVWYSNVTEMALLGGSVVELSDLPTPGTVSGVTFAIDPTVAIYNQDTGNFYYYDGADWVSLA
jgi:hypothetical protein